MMEMSRAESQTSKEEKGNVKTEVPTKVQRAKRKCKKYYTFSKFLSVLNTADSILKLFQL